MNAPPTTALDAALLYASYGLAVLPLKPGTKEPAAVVTDDGRGGWYTATCDAEQLTRLFSGRDNAGIGVCVSRSTYDGDTLMVLDADTDAGYRLLVSLFGEPSVRTGGRGGHWYVRVPGGIPDGITKSSAKHLGIDLFGTASSGYVCAPPTHVAGRDPYTWVGGIYTINDEQRAWLQELAEASKAARKTVIASSDDPARDEWTEDHSWDELLTDEGWTPADMNDSCHCPVWTHPYGATHPKSATAHDEGCPVSNSNSIGGTLKVWSTTAQRKLGGNENYTRYGFVIESRYKGDSVKARKGEDIPSNGGEALDVSAIVYEPPTRRELDPTNPFDMLGPQNEEVNPFEKLVQQRTQDQTSEPQAAVIPMSGLTQQQSQQAPPAQPVTAPAPTPGALPLTPRTAEQVRDELARIKAAVIPTPTNADGKVIGWDGVARTPTDHVRVTKHKMLADLFFTSTPQLANIYNAAVNNKVNPFGLITYLIPLVLGDIPPNYVMPHSNGNIPTVREAGGGLNTINYIVARPSEGKGNTVRTAAELYPHATADIKPNGTAEGIYKVYMQTTESTQGEGENKQKVRQELWYTDTVVMVVNEVGKLNNELKREGSNTPTALCELYMSENAGATTGDKERRTNLPTHMYRYGLVAFGQPAYSDGLLAQKDNGLALRVTFAPGKADWRYAPIGNGAWQAIPANPYRRQFAVSGAERAADVGAPTAGAGFTVIDWAPAARVEVAAAAQEREDHAIETSLDEVEDVVDLSGHETFTRLKNSVAVGVINGRKTPEDLDWYLSGCVTYMSQLMRETLEVVVTATRKKGSTAVAVEKGESWALMDAAKDSFKEEQIVAAADKIALSKWTGPSTPGVVRSDVWAGKDRKEVTAKTVTSALDLLVEHGQVIKDGKKYTKVPNTVASAA